VRRRGPRAIVVTLSALVVLGTSAPVRAAGKPPTLQDPVAKGRALVTEFLTILQEGDRRALSKFLDPAFQLQRADGSGVDKAAYVAAPAVVRTFELGTPVVAVQHDDVLTVRWSVVADVVVDGQQYGKGQAPRLSTFHWDRNRWRMSSHANFNVPA
jgi:hypothetical protein